MAVLTEGKRLGDVLKWEMDPNFCREKKAVPAGTALQIGDICENDANSKKVQITAAVNEVQQIVFGGTPTGGTFVLWIQHSDGVMVPTSALAYNASAATITTALNAACGVTNGIVATGTTLPDQTITFTYSGTGYAGLSKALIVADISSLTGGAPTAVESRVTAGHASAGLADSICLEDVTCADEVQTLTFAGTPTGGTFALTFLHYTGVEVTTAAIAYNASAATVTTACNAVLGTSAVAVTGSTLPDQVLTCTFSGANYTGKPQRLIKPDLSLLTGGTPTCVVARTTEGKDAEAVFLVRGPALVDHNQLDYNSRTEANALAALAALDIRRQVEPTYTTQTT